MDTYLINDRTLVLIPIDSKKTKIIEDDDEFIVNKQFMEIMDYNCKINGSSYYGRYESSKLLIGISMKLPILFRESEREIYFPTKSVRNKNCWWISYNKIQDYYKSEKKVVLVFKNNKKIKLNISFRIFERQILKINKLLLKIKTKKV